MHFCNDELQVILAAAGVGGTAATVLRYRWAQAKALCTRCWCLLTRSGAAHACDHEHDHAPEHGPQA